MICLGIYDALKTVYIGIRDVPRALIAYPLASNPHLRRWRSCCPVVLYTMISMQ